MSKKTNEENTQAKPSRSTETIPHKRIQTAEGWKRSQIKMRKSSSKSSQELK